MEQKEGEIDEAAFPPSLNLHLIQSSLSFGAFNLISRPVAYTAIHDVLVPTFSVRHKTGFFVIVMQKRVFPQKRKAKILFAEIEGNKSLLVFGGSRESHRSPPPALV